jgi:hypothetical protein
VFNEEFENCPVVEKLSYGENVTLILVSVEIAARQGHWNDALHQKPNLAAGLDPLRIREPPVERDLDPSGMSASWLFR